MSDSEHEDLIDSEPPAIDPYEALGLDREATADQVKHAYRKAALKNHPDKVPKDRKEEAHAAFQAIAFAYAILSDPARRKRYDTTGSTSDSIVDSEGFNWSDYYRAQYQDVVSADAIEKFAKKYKGSDEEKDDLLVAYEECEGDMDQIYERVILSNVIEDDERFRKMIDQAIEEDDVPSFKAYKNETKRKRLARRKAADAEAQEAEEYAKELGVHEKLFGDGSARGPAKGKGTKGKKSSEADLAALIQSRHKERSDALFDRLAEKYGATSKKSKKGKKQSAKEEEDDDDDEPSEEAFQAAAARLAKRKAAADSSQPATRSKRTKRS